MKLKLCCTVFCSLWILGCDVVVRPVVNNPSLTIVDPIPIQSISPLLGAVAPADGPISKPGKSFDHVHQDREIVYESRGSWSYTPFRSQVAQKFTLEEDTDICQVGIGIYSFSDTNHLISEAAVITRDDILSGNNLTEQMFFAGIQDGDSNKQFWSTTEDGHGLAFNMCDDSLGTGYEPLHLMAGVEYYVIVSSQIINMSGKEIFWLAK